MIAHQPVAPAAGVPATRIPVAQIVGLFLCRRVRPAFDPAALIDLFDECRTVVCHCGTHFDVQILTAEKVSGETADVIRVGHCPDCGGAHNSHLQFQRNGLILSQEPDGWFVWLSQVTPNRLGNVMEQHLFWYQVDWTKRNAELAEELDLPGEVIQDWRRKIGQSKSPAKRRGGRYRKLPASRPRALWDL